MTVLSRHQGRSIPASAPTSAATLVDHIQNQLLPRVAPFLDRIKATARQRELERQLREEQDRAFMESARIDREKLEARILAEKQEEDEKRAEEEQRLAEEAVRRAREYTKASWRSLARKQLLLGETMDGKDGLRMGIRLPDGQRLIQNFSRTASLTTLYACVDLHFVPAKSLSSEHAEADVPQGEKGLQNLMASVGEDADAWWGFKLFLAYPRKEIPWAPNVQLSDVEGLQGGGQVVVEILNGRRPSSDGRVQSNEDDEYDTEDSV